MLPCEAGSANFFIDPFGDVYPCNGQMCIRDSCRDGARKGYKGGVDPTRRSSDLAHSPIWS